MDSNRRVGNMSANQKELLIEFMEKNPKLKMGKFSNEFTFKMAQKLWLEVTIILNSVPGTRRDWKQWRKGWQDLRTRTKSKMINIKTHRNATGGGAAITDALTSMDDRILDLVGTVSVSGHPNTMESAVDFIMPNSNVEETLEETDAIDSEIIYETEDPIIGTPAQKPEAVPIKPEVQIKSKQSVRIQRLEKTIAATTRLANQSDAKLEIKRRYCEAKLKLLQQNLDLKREKYENELIVTTRIACALETLAQNLC